MKTLPASLENLLPCIFLTLLIILTLLYPSTGKISFFLLLEIPLILCFIFFFKNPLVVKKSLFYWLFFLASLVFAYLFTISPSRSFVNLLLSLSYFLFFFLSLNLFNSKNLKLLISGLIINSLTLSLVSFYYLLPDVKKPETVMNLVYSLYGHSHLADFLLLSLPLVIVFYLKKKTLLRFLVLSFLFLSFLLTFSRASFLVLSLTLFFLFYQLKKFNFQKFNPQVFLFFLIPVFWLLGIFASSLLYPIPLGKPPKNWLERQAIKRVDTKRLEYFHQALVIFKNHAITGSGPGTFYLGSLRYQKSPVSWSEYSHNHYLQTLSETGVLGFTSFSLLLAWLLKTNFKIVKREKNPYLIALYAGLLASTLHSFFDFDWQFPGIFIWFWVINAVILSFSRKTLTSQKLKLPFFVISLFLFILGFIFLFFGNPIKADPQNPEIYLKMAEKNQEEGKFEEARKNFAEAAKFNPLDDPSIYQKWAQISLNPKEKIQILKKYYHLTSAFTWQDCGFKTKEISKLYYQLGKTLYEEKNYPEAEKMIVKTLNDLDNWELDYYALLKKILIAQGKEESYSFYSLMCQKQLPREPRCF